VNYALWNVLLSVFLIYPKASQFKSPETTHLMVPLQQVDSGTMALVVAGYEAQYLDHECR